MRDEGGWQTKFLFIPPQFIYLIRLPENTAICFSAEISFGAAAVIGTTGVLAMRKARSSNFRLFAMIPIFFAIQQAAEGVVWLALSNEDLKYLLPTFTYVFIFFAWIIWPFFVPYAFWRMEKNFLRKRLLLFLVYLGFAVSAVLLFVMTRDQVYATVVDCSIHYGYSFSYDGKWFLGVAYVMVTILPVMLSSLKLSWLLGILNLGGYFASKIYWDEQVISIWCFFAAVSSILIYYLIHTNQKYTDYQ